MKKATVNEMAQNGSSEEGNTKTSSRVNSKKNWCFTWNNYIGSNLDEFKEILNSCSSWVYGYEVGESGTPHLQGYVEFVWKMRPSEMKGLSKKIHWEARRGTRNEAIAYCIKDGNYETNMKLRKKVYDPMIKIDKEYGFKDWQLEILELIKNPCEDGDRRIFWYWDATGGTGKSTFTKHLILKYDALMVTGKGNDIKFIVAKYLEEKDLEIVIFDLPRVSEGHLSYSALEEIKNGCICSGKFEGCSKVFNKPHVIVFANYAPPNYEYLSADRWVVRNIDN